MRILMVMTHPGYARNFEWALREWAERGHEIHVAVEKRDKDPGVDALLESLAGQYEGITTGKAPAVGRFGSARLAQVTRAWLDYLRYLEPVYADATKLRARAGRRIPALVRWVSSREGLRTRVGSAAGALHEGLPTSRRIRRYVRELGPDVVMATPLLELGSPQPEYLRAARRLGIRTVVPVASWDNLTNKGLFHERPDLITVWNPLQVREIRDLHGLPEDGVEVTGAVAYDHWFDWEPTAAREDLCERLGLDPERPFVLYVGSSPFIAPGEAAVALRWVEGLRARDPRLHDLQILVRPHPQNPMRGSARARLRSMPGVALYPPGGANPMDEESRNDYFDSIFHSAAVLGINTSALLEATIVGRPVHSLLEPEYEGSQMGTLHFRHLLPENGGVLGVATDLDDLAQAVARSIDGELDEARSLAFVERFLRPHGLDEPASPRLVESVETLPSRLPAGPQGIPAARRVLGIVCLVPALVVLGLATLAGALRALMRRGIKAGRAALTIVADSVVPYGPDGVRRIWPRPDMKGGGAGSWKLRSETSYLRSQLGPLSESDARVIAGPFLGEVGFELLYWIPFLRWSVAQRPDLAERLVIASRGGTRGWYGDLATDYVDVLDVVDVQRLAEGTERLKQRGGHTPLEEDVHAAVRERLGIENAEILHPSPLWRTYYRSLKVDERAYVRSVRPGVAGEPLAGLNSLYARLEVPDPGPVDEALPDGDFVAVRFYFRPSFPDTDENRRLARQVVQALASEIPVVLLNNGLELDDHRDLDPGIAENVTDLAALMTPSNNLEIQSIAISRARAFVGTYGGLAYLAPHYGVPSVGFADDQRHCFAWHLELAQRLFQEPGWGHLSLVSSHDPDAVARALACIGERVS